MGFKRISDLVLGTVLLVFASPLLLVISLAILLSMGPPVIFRQVRAGYRGRPFTIYKFRTMTFERDSDGQIGADEMRLTVLGKCLRRASLDELPELMNVIRGDMSLVGPRPLPMEYIPLYSPRQALRHRVRPGLTGLAQVSGRNSLTWEEKFELDVRYVEHWSFWLDLNIMLVTPLTILLRRDISAPGHATMPPFAGTKSVYGDGVEEAR